MVDETVKEPSPLDATLVHGDTGEVSPVIDQAKARDTMEALIVFDHRLRDEGSSLIEILSRLAASTYGIHLN